MVCVLWDRAPFLAKFMVLLWAALTLYSHHAVTIPNDNGLHPLGLPLHLRMFEWKVPPLLDQRKGLHYKKGDDGGVVIGSG